MDISIIGAGYVGLVTGACLAKIGHKVIIIDKDPAKINKLEAGKMPIYESGLSDMVNKYVESNRLSFSTDIRAIATSDVIYLAVGTPSNVDGSANLNYIKKAAIDVAKSMGGGSSNSGLISSDSSKTLEKTSSSKNTSSTAKSLVIVIKSTVPPGTNRKIKFLMRKETTLNFNVVSNPEFLKEGVAIQDFMNPDRIVLGSDNEEAFQIMEEVYDSFTCPILKTTPESAELIKYASNAMLASRISFMNEMAAICSGCGADIEEVRKGMELDKRIGSSFLSAGLGYGGSCFPKDVNALSHICREYNKSPIMCDAINISNISHRVAFIYDAIIKLKSVVYSPTKITIWGLSFKPETDDVRESPALNVMRILYENNFEITMYDPIINIDDLCGKLEDDIKIIPSSNDLYDDLIGSHALIICTEHKEFENLDYERVKQCMFNPFIIDGRNMYNLEDMKKNGIDYFSVGRPFVKGVKKKNVDKIDLLKRRK